MKEKIINTIKEYNLLNLKYQENQKEYDFCIEVFKRWCLYVHYIYNAESFYLFMCEFGDPCLTEEGRIQIKSLNIYSTKSDYFCRYGLANLIKHNNYHIELNVKDFKYEHTAKLVTIKD